MKTRINLVGNCFTHLTGGNKGYAVHGKESKYIQWVQDATGEGTFYIDEAINQAVFDTRPGPKYAWLLESKFITPRIVEEVKSRPQTYLQTFQAIFTHNQELLQLDPKFKWVPAQGCWIQEPNIYKKTRLVSMIASNKRYCEGHLLRLQWVERLRGQVDLFGRGFNEIAFKEEGLCDYMFSVAIENGQYRTYFTEKLLDCFATGTIPIYLGAPDIGDHFNLDGIVELAEGAEISPDLYHQRKEAIRDNLELARKMEILEDFIWTNYLV